MLQFIDLRLAVLGNVDAGKSTILGVLTQGELDNGRGRARLNLFRHLHEIQSGRTSSISHEILGFNSKGEVCCSRHQHTCVNVSVKLICLLGRIHIDTSMSMSTRVHTSMHVFIPDGSH